LVEEKITSKQGIQMKEKIYYIYAAYVDGVLRYIGKGSGDRYKHCTSGRSSCVDLNIDLFNGK